MIFVYTNAETTHVSAWISFEPAVLQNATDSPYFTVDVFECINEETEEERRAKHTDAWNRRILRKVTVEMPSREVLFQQSIEQLDDRIENAHKIISDAKAHKQRLLAISYQPEVTFPPEPPPSVEEIYQTYEKVSLDDPIQEFDIDGVSPIEPFPDLGDFNADDDVELETDPDTWVEYAEFTEVQGRDENGDDEESN